ncbi:MAG: apolipoprotein N-acyltransferase, partial [Cyanobacteria bacterium REEB65]|nr:apolipoprotein N-acyltransferase [Cyanobacteria bacterium REEB65]
MTSPSSPDVLEAPLAAARPLSWRAPVAIACGGAALGLAFPGYAAVGSPLSFLLPLLAWVAIAPWFYWIGMADRHALRRDFLLSLFLGIGFEATLNYWLLAMYPLDFLGLSRPEAALVVFVAWAGVSGVFGVGIAIAGMAYGWFSHRCRAVGFPGWLMPLFGAAFWILLEWAQSQGELAYPWGVLAVSQTPYLPLLQILPIGGPYLVSFIVALGNASLAEAWRGERRPLAAAAALAIGALFFGIATLQPTPSGTLKVAAIQGNIGEGQKWSPQAVDGTVDRYLELSGQAPDAQVVVWPESAIPILWNDPNNPATREAVKRIRAAFARPGRYLLTGAFFYRPKLSKPGDVDLYNATTVVGPGIATWHWEAKRHLVPFGEFMPFRGLLPDILAKLNVLTHDLSRGDGPHPFTLPGVVVGSGVCFDSIFPRTLADDTKAGATLLAVVTN